MTKIIICMAAVLLIAPGVFANDVVIDGSGNVETGIASPSGGGNLDVTGTSGEHAIFGSSSGTGAAGVYGESTDSGYGVQGFSDSGTGGYFYSATGYGLIIENGNVGIGTLVPAYNLDVSGSINASIIKVNGLDVLTSYSETDPVFSGSSSFGITSGMINIWNTAYGWGDHSIAGYDTTNDSWTGTGDIYTTSGNVGIGTAIPGNKLDVRGNVFGYLGNFQNIGTSSGVNTWGITAEGNAYATVTGIGEGAMFKGVGGSAGGAAYGTQNYAYAFGSSDAMGVYGYASAEAGKAYAFYGIGDGYFSGKVGINTETPAARFHIVSTGFDDAFIVEQNGLSAITVNSNGSLVVGDSATQAIFGVYPIEVPSTLEKGVAIDFGEPFGGRRVLDIFWDRMVFASGYSVGIGADNPTHQLEVSQQGGVNDFVGYFDNTNISTGQSALGISSTGNAFDTDTGLGIGAVFNGFGGSTSGVAYGSSNHATARGTSNAYGVYSDATAGSTTGKEYAFYGLGDGYFSGDVGIGTTTPKKKLDIDGEVRVALGENTCSSADDYGTIQYDSSLDHFYGCTTTGWRQLDN